MKKIKEKIKRFFCKIGWHSFSYDYVYRDEVNVHAKCKWCGKEGLVDSQGNLF